MLCNIKRKTFNIRLEKFTLHTCNMRIAQKIPACHYSGIGRKKLESGEMIDGKLDAAISICASDSLIFSSGLYCFSRSQL